jgi:isochorismate synthase
MDNTENISAADSWVFYRRPVTSEIVHLTGKSRVVKRNDEWLNQKGFVIAPFDRSAHDTYFIDIESKAQVHTEYEISEIFNDGLKIPCKTSLEKPWRDISKREYLSLINQVKAEIEDSGLEKVVLSRVINVSGVRRHDAATLFIDLCVRYPNAFVYLFYVPKAGMWLGATPETLITGEDDRYRIVSLAGTAEWKPELSFDQLWDSKELMEQQIVTDFVKKEMYEAGIDNYMMKGPETIKAGRLAHIRSTFRFSVDDSTVVGNLIDRIHPTPAVCGLPKREAMELINDIERYDRTYYTGFLGPVCEDGLSLFVSLRCLRYTNVGVELYVGGGITKDSDPKAEWQETEMKALTLLDVIR